MHNHFGKGLLAGPNTASPHPCGEQARFCNEYTRGFVLGYCYRLWKQTGEKSVGALEAGRLTRQYRLDRDIMVEFFTEFKSDRAVHYFNLGYGSRG
ncbi:DUF2623 family protein [Pluralibacter gergoviae]|nr:DUF2623 family protein [Pluralibacter gergoviae]ELK5592637.1 DUF2623 family protein [Pluralibacter gergoviae]